MTGGSNISALKTALAAAEARVANGEAKVSGAEAEIAFLKLTIEKLRREMYGWRSEHKQRLLDQQELQLDELEASATEDELAAEQAAAGTTQVKGFARRKPAGKPFPAHLPRERVVVPGPTSCACYGSEKRSKIGEDVTETLEVIPRRWKVIQTVREKFTCRHCEKISQPPAPFHATPRGWAGPNLLAMIVFEKYGQHQLLNRQRDRYAREGVDLSLSTLADQVGVCTVALRPLHDRIAAHVLAAERLHDDDTPVPVLAKGKTATARAWVYVRDDAPFGGPDPLAALFRYSRDRSGDHPVEHLRTFPGSSRRTSTPATTASMRPEDRRDLSPRQRAGRIAGGSSSSSPTSRPARDAARTLRRSPARAGGGEADRRAVRHRARDQRQGRRAAPRRTPGAERAGAGRSQGLDAGRAQEAVAPFPRGQGDGLHAQAPGPLRPLPRRRPHLPYEQRRRKGTARYRFGQEVVAVRRLRPRRRADAAMYTLIGTAKLNNVNPQAWLADVLDRIAGTPQSQLDELLPWNWQDSQRHDQAA